MIAMVEVAMMIVEEVRGEDMVVTAEGADMMIVEEDTIEVDTTIGEVGGMIEEVAMVEVRKVIFMKSYYCSENI